MTLLSGDRSCVGAMAFNVPGLDSSARDTQVPRSGTSGRRDGYGSCVRRVDSILQPSEYIVRQRS